MFLDKNGIIKSASEPQKNRRKYWYDTTKNEMHILENGKYLKLNKPINIVTGKEFETPFTRNGKTVYGKEVNFGELPNSITKQVEHGISSDFKLLKMECSFKSNTGVQISFDCDGINPSHGTTAMIFGYISKYHIVLVTNHNANAYSGTVTLYYIKN